MGILHIALVNYINSKKKNSDVQNSTEPTFAFILNSLIYSPSNGDFGKIKPLDPSSLVVG